MNEIEKEIVVEHFNGELDLYIHNSETCCNNGLRKIYANKAHWLALLLELSKKQIPEKPDYEGDGYDDEGNLILDTWICPCCGDRYEVGYEVHKFCPMCGQAIDWSENT